MVHWTAQADQNLEPMTINLKIIMIVSKEINHDSHALARGTENQKNKSCELHQSCATDLQSILFLNAHQATAVIFKKNILILLIF